MDKVPTAWHDGDEVAVERVEVTPTAEELDAWIAELNAAASQISDEDHDRAMAAITQHRAEAKRWMRREMGLPE
jgi:hypothetical protein